MLPLCRSRTLLVVLLFAVVSLLAACGGGGGSGGAAPPPAPPASTGIGASGGTVNGPAGAKVVVPAGALSADTAIAIAQSSAGAPEMPASFKLVGDVFALTPHGTQFAKPVTITIPFTASLVPAGMTPILVKTNSAQTAWIPVAGATVSGNAVVGDITGFSYAGVVLASYEDTFAPVPRFRGTPVTVEPIKSNNADQDISWSWGVNAADVLDLLPKGWLTAEQAADVPTPRVEFHVGNHGQTYWVSAEAPVWNAFVPNSAFAYQGTLTHKQKFTKVSDVATLSLRITQLETAVADGHAYELKAEECALLGGDPDECRNHALFAFADFNLAVWRELPNQGQLSLVDVGAYALLRGYRSHFVYESGPYGANHGAQFSMALIYDPEDENTATLKLDAPVDIAIPLDQVAKGEQFYVQITSLVDVQNVRGGDAFAGARFRDPQKTDGMDLIGTGIEPVVDATPQPFPAPPPVDRTPAPECTTGVDAAAGSIAFGGVATHTADVAHTVLLPITRSGGSKGAVSALLDSHDGSAIAGTHYEALVSIARFADGESGTRYVPLRVLDDTDVNAARSFTVTMSGLSGCATLGTPTTYTVTIDDNDAPLPTATTYSLGGTVTGLVGTGLVLADATAGNRMTVDANGGFTLGSNYLANQAYDVRIESAPGNPLQSCAVTNGAGAFATADVTNVLVTCDPPAPVGSLDPAFGGGLRNYNGLAPAQSVALQGDGKIVVVGGMQLSRFLVDGTPDTSFGTGGTVTVVGGGGSFQALEAVAIQPDGRIVVAGHTSTPPSLAEDFLVQRFNADGTLDGGFGIGGKLVTDFSGGQDAAYALAVQTDGRIVVGGLATLGTGSAADQDFALARYLADGTPDAAFGSGGKVTANVGGKADFGYALALQPDGRIVVAGRVGASGGADPDFGVARFQSNGTVETGFTGARPFAAGIWDEARDVVIQGDGKILLGGYAMISGTYQYAVMRLDAQGGLDTGFGTQGVVASGFANAHNFGKALALQADGRIVVAGQISTLLAADFGVWRLTSSGAVDAAFGTGGLVDLDFAGATDGARDVVIGGDGKILVVGAAVNGGSASLGMARVLP